MAKMQEFKCPCCGGSIEFDSSVQKMKCPFCDTEFDVGTLSEYAQTVEEEQPEDMSWSDEAGSEWQDGESEGLRTYVCKSCGGEIVGDANTAATACPFCGSPVVMTGQLSGALKPDYVIPFKLDKKAAKERLKKHLTGKRLLPKAFKSENHISEVKGIYVPFWLYDTDADADADTDTDGDASNDAEKTCDSVEDGKDLDDIVIPEDGLSYFGYDINAIKDASDENTAKRFLQLENNMKETFPFSLGNYADCLLNQGKLLDSETGEPLENVDESKLMSHITKYILATYENYILTRPTESLQSEFDDTIKSEIDDGSIQPEDEEKVREIISHVRTPIAKPAEATDNSAPDETATDDEAVSLEDILG